LLDIVKGRRSIRRYEPRPVPPELVCELLEAAIFAPSPHNRQPWRFAVLTELPAKERLAAAMGARLRADRARDGDPPDAIEADVARSRARICGAPVALLAALTMADMDVYDDPARSAAEHLMAVQATAAAIQNLLLLAHSRGLGASWMCAPLFCPEVVRAALPLPEDWQPQALITLGYPAGPGRERPRRPLSDSVLWVDRTPAPTISKI
jgi:F420 biosynthesis protein FbiB-like protein